MRSFITAIAFAVTSSACMTAPHHGQVYPSKSTPIQFTFYAITAGATIEVSCGPGYFDPYQPVFSVQASTHPLTLNGDTVYAASRKQVLPDSCWQYVHGRWMTRIRPRHDGRQMRVYTESGLDCLGEKLGDGEPMLLAGNDCAMTYANSSNQVPYVRIHANP